MDIGLNEKKRRGLVVCCRNGEFKEGRRWYRKRVMGYLFICQIKSYVMMNFMICLSYCFFEWPDIAIKNPFSIQREGMISCPVLWTTSPVINKKARLKRLKGGRVVRWQGGKGARRAR